MTSLFNAVKYRLARKQYRYLVGIGEMKPSHDLLGELSLAYYAARKKWYAEWKEKVA